MREIKFRAWDSGEKRMWSHYEIDDSDKDGIVLWGGLFNGSEKMELMQYTGLKDKNGKEIYDGDIVRHREYGYPEKKESLVEFSSGGFYPFSDNEDNAPYPEPELSEIIGNIHENPELLS